MKEILLRSNAFSANFEIEYHCVPYDDPMSLSSSYTSCISRRSTLSRGTYTRQEMVNSTTCRFRKVRTRRHRCFGLLCFSHALFQEHLPAQRNEKNDYDLNQHMSKKRLQSCDV